MAQEGKTFGTQTVKLHGHGVARSRGGTLVAAALEGVG